MASSKQPPYKAGTFDPAQARWVSGMLNMLIAAVGPASVLGVVLSQARCEVLSLLAGVCVEDPRRSAA
jgi:hypothetical protein